REGLRITSGPGSLVTSVIDGRIEGIFVGAADLAYQYAIPQGLDIYQAKNKILLDRHKEDFLFKPEYVRFNCDPTSCDELMKSVFTGAVQVGTGKDGAAKLAGTALGKVW